MNAPKAKDLVTLPEYFSQYGYHSLSMGKIFHRHPFAGDIGNKKSDAGQWAFDWGPTALNDETEMPDTTKHQDTTQ